MHLTEDRATATGVDGTPALIFKGFLIGIANIIPGVSGGTFALILGLFDRMIAALHSIGFRTVRATLGLLFGGFGRKAREEFAEEWRRADMWFLVRILIGAMISILLCSELLKWLLRDHPGVTLAFFLGLIIPSLAVPWGMMKRRGAAQLFWIVPGIAVTVGLSLAFREGVGGKEMGVGMELGLACASGAVAISAMILPGISGSFVMLVLGQYQKVLGHLTTRDLAALMWLGSMAIGCVLGLLLFSRLLHWLLKRWRSATMAFLIGLVLGSFWVLWPFKDFEAGGKVHGRKGTVKRGIQVATAPQRLPASWSEAGVKALGLALGLGCAVGLNAFGKRGREEEASDPEAAVAVAGE